MSSDQTKGWNKHLLTKTRALPESQEVGDVVRVPLLTILCHGDPQRIGECAWLPELEEGHGVSLSRLDPQFCLPEQDGPQRPLAEPHMSRKPIRIVWQPGGILFDVTTTSTRLEIDGIPVEQTRTVTEEELEEGVTLLISKRVTLLLQRAEPVVQRPPQFGLLGESPAMLELRRQIEAVSALETPVLLRGPSGTGKELVAGAIQAHGPRREGPFLTLNMGAIPAPLAVSELFGATKGAFSGADKKHRGYFQRADQGTLFLDEIGETPLEVQALLLRALDNGEIQPLGSEKKIKVDVRLISATDADLEAAIHQGSFKEPLLHRLRGFDIHLPPLRRRLADLGRLFFFFLRQELASLGNEEKLHNPGPYGRPYVPARLLARIAHHHWPGNVRELRNLVRQIVVASRDSDHLLMDVLPDSLLDGSTAVQTAKQSVLVSPTRDMAPVSEILGAEALEAKAPEVEESKTPSATKQYRDWTDVGERELLAALKGNGWNLKVAAQQLNISRSALYRLIENTPSIKKASDLQPQEIMQARESVGTSLDKMAEALEVSKQGLKRRMKKLNL